MQRHLRNLEKNKEFGVYNLGMGKGYSVLEIITKFEEVTGLKVKREIVERRNR